jgi:hypothetical protein
LIVCGHHAIRVRSSIDLQMTSMPVTMVLDRMGIIDKQVHLIVKQCWLHTK